MFLDFFTKIKAQINSHKRDKISQKLEKKRPKEFEKNN